MRGFWGIACGGLCLAAPAWAGPWAQEQGNWYLQAAVTQEELEDMDGNRVELYGEYGVADGWLVTAKSEAVTYDSDYDLDKEAARLSVRRQLLSHKGWAVGAEGGLVYGSSVAGVFGCDAWGAEARLSGGLSGVRGARSFYTFADAAVIRHEDGCTRYRAEIGYGVDVWKNVFLSQQLWIERGNDTADSNKYETKLGYHFPWVDLALGYRQEFAGEYDEQAILLAMTVKH